MTVDEPPSCSDLGLREAVRIPGPAGPLRTGVVEFEVDGEPHRVALVVARDGPPVVFNWTSDLGMAAVVVAGGGDAAVYDYREALDEAGLDAVRAGDRLTGPFNENAGRFFPITSVTFCYAPDGGQAVGPAAVGRVGAAGGQDAGSVGQDATGVDADATGGGPNGGPDAGGAALLAGMAAATVVAVRRRS